MLPRSLDRILAVAETELGALVRSKAFLVSVLILPAVMLVMSFAQKQLAEHADTRPKTFAVVDAGGRSWEIIAKAAAEHNARLGQLERGHVVRVAFAPVRVAAGEPLERLRLALSDRVRREELFAFVEIPAEPDRDKLRYYSDHPAYDDLREWLTATLDDALRSERYQTAHLDPRLVDALSRHVSADALGLWTRDADGRIRAAEKLDVVRAVIVPVVPMFLLFFFVLMSVPQLMNAVLTEKLTRISEVLLGSLSPFELMAGKLCGAVAVSLLLGVLYVTGGLVVAQRMGVAAAIPPALVAWFLAFLVLAMLLYGAAAMAIGAACNDVKDTQNLMLPVMLPIMLPMFVASSVVESPSSPLAVALSLFPPATPLAMLLRVGLHPAPPLWQVTLSAVLTLATTVACVWAAGRIFRVGLLMQGKSASLAEMARWIFTR
jgi:ABC-2 type transport system permease protein